MSLNHARASKGWWHILRLVGAVLIIAITLYVADPSRVWQRLLALQLSWALVGLGLSLPLQILLALRWKQIANRIAAPLSFGLALRGYYQASFVNQALPTGLAGAGLRALLHSRQLRSDGRAIGLALAATAVILDRLSGLMALCAFAIVGTAVLGSAHAMAALVGSISVVAIVGMGCGVLWLAARHPSDFGRNFVTHARTALWNGDALWKHSILSAASVLLLSATFYCAARASGVDLSFPATLLIAPLVLGAMALPLSIGGWGLREATAAALFAAMGMAPASGVAVSIAFGVITLLASAPGLVLWLAGASAPAPDADTQPVQS